MGFQNSRIDEESLVGLSRQTIRDLYDAIRPFADRLPAYRLEQELLRDLHTLNSRYAAEGLSFLTVTLPKHGKYVDNKLSGYKVGPPKGLDLVFLRSAWKLLDLIIEAPDESPATGAFLKRLRTVFYMFYKLDLPPTQEQVDLAIAKFLQIEEEVSRFVVPETGLVNIAARVCKHLLLGYNPQREVFPHHGPGSVATGETGDEKWVFSHLYDSLHQRFPYYDFMYGIRENGRALQLASRAERYRSMTRLPYPTAKLCVVPKDSRGPRIISSEPLELQYMQQAIAGPLMRHLERYARLRLNGEVHDVSHHINFLDQSINAGIALSSSKTGLYATLDLNEASDRVAQTLFEAIWPKRLIADFNALRSHATLLPNGSEVKLGKYAPMGSALCFPVESTIFYCLCVAAIALNECPLTSKEANDAILYACRNVWVYGDDLIVPTRHFNVVGEALESVGLKINDIKSLAYGYFRESCGTDAWHGHNVTPVRLRKLLGHGPESGTAHVAWLSTSSRLYAAEMVHSGEYCKRAVETQLGTAVPFTSVETNYLSVVDPSRHSSLSEYCDVQWSVDLSMPTAIVWVMRPKRQRSSLDGWERLHRNLLQFGEEFNPDLVVARSSATQISRKRAGLGLFDLREWLLSAEGTANAVPPPPRKRRRCCNRNT